MQKNSNNLFTKQKVHFVGIGGISMSALAAMYYERGGQVTGSDIKNSLRISQLEKMGIEIFLQHSQENISDQDLLVYSSAISNDNIEIKTALDLNIPVISRAEFLTRLTSGQRVIAVSGTHGKTTTTAMISEILLKAGIDPSVMIGGELNVLSGNYNQGKDDIFVIEADESDGSLINYRPWLGIITNLEAEHLNYYQDEAQLIQTMKKFISRINDEGYVILNADDPIIRTYLIPYAADEIKAELLTFGINAGDFRADKIDADGFFGYYNILTDNKGVQDIKVNSPGRHNILNSLAASAAARALGINWNKIRIALKDYGGVKRRFEKKGECGEIMVVDDYAHHPTEIFATYQTAVKIGFDRVLTVFQPHRYTRTRALWDEFIDVLCQVKYLLICDIYAANQEPISGINSQKLTDELISVRNNDRGWVNYAGGLKQAQNFLLSEVGPGDLVLTLGAGDVYEIGENLLEVLRSNKGG